jgi:hypothetical protein
MKYYNDYKDFLVEIFGEDKISFQEEDFIDNNIVGAIGYYNKEKEYDFFFTNFKKRLQKLRDVFKDRESVLNDIILKAENIGKKKWFGEYSELVAYDFFSDFFVLETEIMVDKEKTYASILPNRQASSFDGKINKDNFELIFEVKCLTDIANELLQNIIKITKSRNSSISNITVDYDLAIDYKLIENNFGDILNKLNEAITKNQNSMSYENWDLRFRIHYQAKRIISSERHYLTSNHVESLKYFFLNHFDQVFLNDKNLLVYVAHPWFNLINTNDFLGKKEFIESFASTCFNELINTEEEISQVTTKWTNVNVKVKDVAKRISGILFLFDNNVVKHATFQSDNYNSIIEGHLFMNENALHRFKEEEIQYFKDFKRLYNKNLEIYGC